VEALPEYAQGAGILELGIWRFPERN
jgi:hypothetical protein